jgi:hypothetical protein
MPILSFSSLGSVVEPLRERARLAVEEEPEPLPGITLASYTIKDIHEPFFQKYAEVFLFGVAVDGNAKILTIPFGQAQLAEQKDANIIRKMPEGGTFTYIGDGLPLVVPPVKDFLALRLLLADSDSTARDAADAVKGVGETVSSKEAIALLVAAGLPQAAAVATVLGKSLEVASKMLAKNKDDVIEAFEGYFSPAAMTPDTPLTVDNPGASAIFRFVAR